jgi:hypothetical protein
MWGRRPGRVELDVEGDDRLASDLGSILWPQAVPWA